MESWVGRKKRTKRQIIFNKLPGELQIDIFNRLSGKDLSRAMCVSKSLRDIILFTCLPMVTPSTIRFLGLLICMKYINKRKRHQGWLSVCVDNLASHPFVVLDLLLNWCMRVMHCSITPRKVIDSCNGLLLFAHKDCEVENLTHGVYHYYVINPISKQCVAVLKPGPSSPLYMYAALAYDPTESPFFKIVRFQGWRHIQVFSSEMGCWTSLRLQLRQEVGETEWVQKSIYNKGAVYRLSFSGHLIKFLVDPQDNAYNQAKAIKFPCSFRSHHCQRDIGVRHKKVIFVESRDTMLNIWELAEYINGSSYSFGWYLTHKINDVKLWELNNFGLLLSIHPYHDIVLFKFGNTVYYYFCGHNTTVSRRVKEYAVMYGCIKTFGFPLLECSIPFACCLDKEHPRLFQWLPIPMDCRGVGVYN